MRGGWRASWTIPLIAVVLLSGPARAAFELELRTPAERGAATHMALGQLEGSFHLPLLDRAGRPCPLGVTLYGFRPFGIGEVGAQAAWGAVPIGKAGHGICVAYQRFGALSYLEETIILGCSLRSGNLWFRPGVRVGLIRFEDRMVDSAVLLDLALGMRPLASIKVVVTAENPLGSLSGGGGARGPSCLRAGMGCLISSWLAWGVEVAKYTFRPTSVATGIEAIVVKGVVMRSGLRSDPAEFSLGLGFAVGSLSVDIATSLNLLLGSTHEVGITYVRR